jgi:hypothetical protein
MDELAPMPLFAALFSLISSPLEMAGQWRVIRVKAVIKNAPVPVPALTRTRDPPRVTLPVVITKILVVHRSFIIRWIIS